MEGNAAAATEAVVMRRERKESMMGGADGVMSHTAAAPRQDQRHLTHKVLEPVIVWPS